MSNKSILNRTSGLINRHKWELIGALKLNNLNVNRIIRPINDLGMREIQIETTNLELSITDY